MAIGLHQLAPAEGATHRRKRLGRGIGSGHGKTCGRGTKGNKARDQIKPNFEGGQTPLHRRLPQKRGFRSIHKKVYALVNLYTLEESFSSGAVVTPEVLLEKGLIRTLHDGLKVLGDGELTKKLTVHAHKFSKSAQQKIEAAGGTIEVLGISRKTGAPVE